jgi:hypothetical protein
MLRAIRRQVPTDLKTLGFLSGEKRGISISLADRAAAGVPAVPALRDSTWNAKKRPERREILIAVPEWQSGTCIRW